MVLVGYVEIVKHPESCAFSTLIRFSSVNRIYSTLRHAFYSSGSLGFVFCGTIPDWISGLLGGGRTVDVNELVGKVVKGASEVVDNVSGDKSNFDGRGLDIENAVQVISSLRVVLAFDSIRLAADESIPCDFQIMEVYAVALKLARQKIELPAWGVSVGVVPKSVPSGQTRARNGTQYQGLV